MIRRVEFLLIGLLAGCGPSLEPTFDAISAEVFVPSCSFGVCHGPDAPQNDLNLSSAEDAWATLSEAPVDSPMERLVPGDPDSSLLYTTLLADVDDVERMPKGGMLEDYQIEAIRQWIEDGAER